MVKKEKGPIGSDPWGMCRIPREERTQKQHMWERKAGGLSLRRGWGWGWVEADEVEGQGQQQVLVTILQSLAPLGANMRAAEELESQLSDSRVLGLNFLPTPSCKILLQGAHSVLARGRGWGAGRGLAATQTPSSTAAPRADHVAAAGFRLPWGSQKNPLPPGGDLDAAVKGNLTSAAPQEMRTGQVSRGPRPPISVTGATKPAVPPRLTL